MARLSWVAFAGILSMSQCHFQLTPPAFQVTVYPDGSGEAICGVAIPTEFSTGEAANKDGLLTGGDDTVAATMTFRMIAAKFRSVDKLRIGEVSFATQRDGESLTLKITIPITPDARWMKTLGPTPTDLERMKRIESSWPVKAPQDTSGDMKAMPDTVVFQITMPGIISRQSVEGVDQSAGYKTTSFEEGRVSGRAEEKNIAELTIPLNLILLGKARELVWEVNCGPSLKRVREEWEKSKR